MPDDTSTGTRPTTPNEPPRVAHDNTLGGRTAIEGHLDRIETHLNAINELNDRLDQIQRTLDTVIGFATEPRSLSLVHGPDAESTEERSGR